MSDSIDDRTIPAGLFRTPLACALLAGAVVVACNQGLYSIVRYLSQRHSRLYFDNLQWFFAAHTLIIGSVTLAGPLIFRRTSRAAVSCFLAAMTLAAIEYGGTRLCIGNFSPSTGMEAFFRFYAWGRTICLPIEGAVLGILLAYLYGYKQRRIVCAALGAAFSILLIGLVWKDFFFRVAHSFDFNATMSVEGSAFTIMYGICCNIGQQALIAIPIDREFRRQRAQSAQR